MTDPMAPMDGEGTPGREAIRAQLERILASAQFANAPSMGKMLRFVVEHALDGTADRIKEYTLGVEVFGRGSDFDPRQDTIVRVQGRRLRDRLDDYYNHNGIADPVGIGLPKGHYVPSFCWREDTSASVPATATDPPLPRPTRWAPRMLALGVAGLLALALIATFNSSSQRPPPDVGKAPHRIAVLPFADMSPNRDQEYIADGLTEELIHRLAQSPSLQVIARTSVFALKGKAEDVRSIARKLDVDRVIEGSVRQDGERVRITVQLIDAATDTHLWSQTYDRSPDDLFAVQGEIAEAAATTLGVSLRPGQAAAKAAPDPEAYALYLRARFHLNRRGEGDLDHAETMLRQATRIDPGFAQAWEGLASTLYLQTGASKLKDPELLQTAQAARRALALDPSLVEARLRLAITLYWSESGEDAFAKELERACRLQPDNPLVLAWAADFARTQGQPRVAIQLLRRALKTDPLSAVNGRNLIGYLVNDGQLDAAEAEIQRVTVLYPEQGPDLELARAALRILQHRPGEALKLLQSLPDSTDRSHLLALAHADAGDQQRAEKALAGLAGAAKPDEPEAVAALALTQAEVWILLDQPERALAALLPVPRPDIRTIEGRNALYMLKLAQISPLLRPLHADPRWQAWSREAIDVRKPLDLAPILAALGPDA